MDPNESNPNRPAETGTASSTAYLWEAPGKSVSVYLDFEVVDRLGFDIMRGFGAVPRRGAEVGGILLGSAEVSGRPVIRIEDYVAVPCEHMRGPSYILSENDLNAFGDVLALWMPAPDKRIYAVGYYRSNTRESLQLAPEDLEILDTRFAGMTAICLMVKPYATRVSEAAIFVREAAGFSSVPAGEVFPFRRRELGGGKPARRPRGAETPDPELEAAATGYALSEEAPAAVRARVPEEPAAPAVAPPVREPEIPADWPPPAKRSGFRGGLVWIPLSFIFLLLGVVLGFQIALSYRSVPPAAQTSDPYLLDLTVVQFGDNLHLKWNTEAAALREARRGLLHIQDGDNSKIVELKPEDLGRGGVLYRNATNDVRFRLEVFPRERNSVAETLELRLLDGSKPQAPQSGPPDAAITK